jgi:restriction endonuclease S subunit
MNIVYVQYVLSCEIQQLIAQANGLIPGIRREIVLEFPLPLPPFSEQRRIVTAIKSVFAQLETIFESIN